MPSEQQATASSSVAALDSTPSYERKMSRTVYGGIGFGISELNPDTSEVVGWDVDDPSNAGGQLTLGADLSKHFSIELSKSDLGSAGLSPEGRISYDILAGSALLYAGKNRDRYRRQGLLGYGRLGFGLLKNNAIGSVNYDKQNGTHVLFGLGLEYMTRLGLGVRAELTSFDTDVQYAQLGLIYRFGRKAQKPAEPYIAKTPEPTPVAAPVIAPVAAIAVDPCAKYEGVLEGVNFQTNSATLTADAKIKLNEVADTLSRCDTSSVFLSGHTDSVGAASYNEQLSQKRVNSVIEYLTSNGVSANRLSGTGYGETQPIADNDSAASRKLNRRVELSLSK